MARSGHRVRIRSVHTYKVKPSIGGNCWAGRNKATLDVKRIVKEWQFGCFDVLSHDLRTLLGLREKKVHDARLKRLSFQRVTDVCFKTSDRAFIKEFNWTY